MPTYDEPTAAAAREPATKVVGAIDVGSNAIRMSCAHLTPDGRIEVIENVRTPVRLGEDVFSTGVVGQATMDRLVDALKLYSRTLERAGAAEVKAYATSAFREAQNRDEVLERVERETGLRLEAIAGGKEAQLLRRAVNLVVETSQGTHMLVDLGGGSVEISILQEGEIAFAESFRLGTVRLLQMFQFAPNQREKGFAEFLDAFVGDFVKEIKPRLGRVRADSFILTGGNAAAVAKLGERFAAGGSSFAPRLARLSPTDFKAVKRELLARTFDQRVAELGLAPDRADVILPAIFVFQKLLKVSGCKTVTIPDVGVRDGILDELLEEHGPEGMDSEAHEIIRSAFFYAKKYFAHFKHAKTVRRLAIQLFDGMAAEHRMGHRERLYLEVAAILHDIGRFIRPSNHHLHSMYLIQNMELVGLTNHELEVVALLARYHNRGNPLKHEICQKMGRDERRMVEALVALLRVADALDREHSGMVRSIVVRLDATRAALHLDSEGDLLLTQWSLNAKKELFERVFQKTIEIKKQLLVV